MVAGMAAQRSRIVNGPPPPARSAARPWMTAPAAAIGPSRSGSERMRSEWVARSAPMMPASASPAPAVASQVGAEPHREDDAVGRRDVRGVSLEQHGRPEVPRGGAGDGGRIGAHRIRIQVEQTGQLPGVRREHAPVRPPERVQCERPGVQQDRHPLAQGRLERECRQLVPLGGILAGSEHPGLHPAVGRHGLRPVLQHQPGRTARPEIAHHPDTGVQRRLDAEHRGARIVRGPGHEPEHPARVLVVVRVRERRSIRRRPQRGDEVVHVLTIVWPR